MPHTCPVCGDTSRSLAGAVTHRTTQHPGSYLSETDRRDPFARFERGSARG